MAQVSFGPVQCLDPVLVARDLRAQGLPIDSFWGRANAYRCPLGQEPGEAWVLLSRASLDLLRATAVPAGSGSPPYSQLDQPQTLTFALAAKEILGVPSPKAQSAALRGLLFLRASCLAPGRRGDPDAPYLCELADPRWLSRASVIDRAYNVRSNPGGVPGGFLSATLYGSSGSGGGSLWTWEQMTADIWAAVGNLGGFPGLPFEPNGHPEGFDFYGDNAYRALGVVLERIGCALAYHPITGTFDMVRVAEADAAAAAALAKYDAQRVWDSDWQEGNRGRVPQYCRVVFPTQRTNIDATGASPYYFLDGVDGTPLPGTVAGTYAIVYDDMAVLYDANGVESNIPAIAVRAAERAADYFRRVRLGRLGRQIIGPRSDIGLRPGAQLRETVWSDYGQGYTTGVAAWPMVEASWPFPDLPGKPTLLTRRVLTDGSVAVRPTGPGPDDVVVLGAVPASSAPASSGGGSGGSGSGSGTAPCVLPIPPNPGQYTLFCGDDICFWNTASDCWHCFAPTFKDCGPPSKSGLENLGPGQLIQTTCCPNPVPQNWIVTVTGNPGIPAGVFCDCLAGQFNFTNADASSNGVWAPINYPGCAPSAIPPPAEVGSNNGCNMGFVCLAPGNTQGFPAGWYCVIGNGQQGAQYSISYRSMALLSCNPLHLQGTVAVAQVCCDGSLNQSHIGSINIDVVED